MKTRSKIPIALLCFLLVFPSIGAIKPPSASEMTGIDSAAESYINVSVNSIQINAPASDLDGNHEFHLFVVASDKFGNSARFTCPGNSWIRVKKGDILNSPCKYFTLGFKEREAPDQVHILFLGVDEDSSNDFADLSYETILSGLSDSLGRYIEKNIWNIVFKVGSTGMKMANMGVGALISFVSGKVKEWLLEQDEVGSQLIVLERSRNWSIQNGAKITTSNGGMTVTFTIERSTTQPNEPIEKQPPVIKQTPIVIVPPSKPPSGSPPKPGTSYDQQPYVSINNIKYPIWKYCSGSLVSVIEKGDFAYVNPVPPLKNRIRDKPSLGSTILTVIPTGQRYRMKVEDGPRCSDGWVWWYVKYKDSNGKTWNGWTAEGDDFWLLPYLNERD